MPEKGYLYLIVVAIIGLLSTIIGEFVKSRFLKWFEVYKDKKNDLKEKAALEAEKAKLELTAQDSFTGRAITRTESLEARLDLLYQQLLAQKEDEIQRAYKEVVFYREQLSKAIMQVELQKRGQSATDTIDEIQKIQDQITEYNKNGENGKTST